ncbi:DUF1028 domain-containing protein [Psychroflexus salis]|uniref:DUF1028 domain-containing protein n=1 Tax=Psychroflexus salis TaxID=1526574 RepID=A0A917EA83_9FLAO|nr:DUF1028 domain-containing protein [Psychroflexus salis]GGE18549.1 hypothetical protein GCM10010831_19610 [Psychroflexus salis]
MKKNLCILLFSVLFLQNSVAQKIPLQDDFAHTYSIVAYDEKTGELAVGVQSHWFAVGKVVPWVKAGVGAIVSQSFVNIDYGIYGLQYLEEGVHPKEAFTEVFNKDEGAAYRQVAIMNTSGEVFAYTGEQCIVEASHYEGKNFSVQANMMANNRVVPSMVEAYQRNAKLPLAERVLASLKAAQDAGGDIRGMQSAALVVVDGKIDENTNPNVKKIDLRVDDAAYPLAELERLLIVHRAYEFMNEADVALEKKNFSKALQLYVEAEKLQPENIEIQFWKALAMMQSSKKDKGIRDMKKIISQHNNWQHLLYRLVEAEVVPLSKADLKALEQ